MIDWVAGAFELSGSWKTGNKKKIGFVLNLLGSIAWIYVAFNSHVYGLLLVVIPAIFINIRNWLKWNAEEKLKDCHGSKNLGNNKTT